MGGPPPPLIIEIKFLLPVYNLAASQFDTKTNPLGGMSAEI